MAAQNRPRVLIQRLHIVGHRVARQNAKPFNQPEGKTPRQTLQGLVPAHRQQRLELRCHLAVNEMLQATADLVGHVEPGFFIDKGLGLRLQRFGPGNQLAHSRGTPHQAALFGEIQLGIRRVIKAVGAQVEFRLQRLVGRLPQRARLVGRGRRILAKAEPFKTADEFAFHRHFALVVHLGHKALLLFQPAHEHTGAPVYKSLGQPRVERV